MDTNKSSEDRKLPWKPLMDGDGVLNISTDKEMASSPQFVSVGRGMNLNRKKPSIQDIKLPCSAKYLLLDETHYVKLQSSEEEGPLPPSSPERRSGKFGKSMGRGRAVYEQLKIKQMKDKPKKVSPFSQLGRKDQSLEGAPKRKNFKMSKSLAYLEDSKNHRNTLTCDSNHKLDNTVKCNQGQADYHDKPKEMVAKKHSRCKSEHEQDDDDYVEKQHFIGAWKSGYYRQITKFEGAARRPRFSHPPNVCVSAKQPTLPVPSNHQRVCKESQQKASNQNGRLNQEKSTACHDQVENEKFGDGKDTDPPKTAADRSECHIPARLETEPESCSDSEKEQIRDSGTLLSQKGIKNWASPGRINGLRLDETNSLIVDELKNGRKKESGCLVKTSEDEDILKTNNIRVIMFNNHLKARKVHKSVHNAEAGNIPSKEIIPYVKSVQEIISSQENGTNHLLKDERTDQELHEDMDPNRESDCMQIDIHKVADDNEEDIDQIVDYQELSMKHIVEDHSEPLTDDWDYSLNDLLADGPCTLEIYNLPVNVNKSDVFEYLTTFGDVLTCGIDRCPTDNGYVGAVARVRMTSSKSCEWAISCLHGEESPFPGIYADGTVPLLVCNKCI
ncbi:uncharacterized protein [Ptychodera flava]|uniref:uncharacterized protein n=1 Tax=Ptychodera flava TaxID=63121 RepID=UPI00396A9A86